MKFFILLALLPAIISCRNSKLKTLVDAANRECPIEIVSVGHITHICYDDTCVVYHFHIDENQIDIDQLRTHQDELKQAMKAMLSSPTPAVREMLNAMTEHTAGLQIVCTGRASGKQTTCTLTSNEVADCSRYIP